MNKLIHYWFVRASHLPSFSLIGKVIGVQTPTFQLCQCLQWRCSILFPHKYLRIWLTTSQSYMEIWIHNLEPTGHRITFSGPSSLPSPDQPTNLRGDHNERAVSTDGLLPRVQKSAPPVSLPSHLKLSSSPRLCRGSCALCPDLLPPTRPDLLFAFPTYRVAVLMSLEPILYSQTVDIFAPQNVLLFLLDS